MTEDLVARLRTDDPWCQPKCDDAADRIERDAATIARLVEALQYIQKQWPDSAAARHARATIMAAAKATP